jgi:hypothetical protein
MLGCGLDLVSSPSRSRTSVSCKCSRPCPCLEVTLLCLHQTILRPAWSVTPHPAKDSGIIAWSIGIVKGKRHCIHNDPYAGGERSGKCAKPDTPSTANAAPPTVESTPGITLPGPAVPVQACVTVPPPTSAPGITPLGVAIPVCNAPSWALS